MGPERWGRGGLITSETGTKRSAFRAAAILGIAGVALVLVVAAMGIQAQAASANLDQCRNGGVNRTPVSCNPATPMPQGWVNGNAQGIQAHWREGESIAYRVVINGLTAGSTNTLDFEWQTVHGGKHALDYITSSDRTEKEGPAADDHANHYDPCSDVLPSSECNPSAPTSQFLIPDPLAAGLLTNCGGSQGTFHGTVAQDRYVKAFGGAGTAITDVEYTAVQVQQGGGQCFTSARVTFAAGSSTVVLTWGGHIASEADWGAGNSASFINGSPYHMILDFLNGASTGSQDRALATSAIFFTPSISTTVTDASTNQPVTGPEPLGASVYDTATLSGAPSIATGTVAYAFFETGDCSGTAVANNSVVVTNGMVPNSPTEGPLWAGSYSFQAYYSGEASTNTFPALSPCESFTVATVTPALSVISCTPPPSTNALGSTVVATATLSNGYSPTGSLTFQVFAVVNGQCSGNAIASTVMSVNGNAEYNWTYTTSQSGTFVFVVSYSGDMNNSPVGPTSCGDTAAEFIVT